jgi:hypothetical protein
MTAFDRVVLRLGGASEGGSNSEASTKTIDVKSKSDLALAREGLTESSLDSLEVIVPASALENLYDPTDLSAWVGYLRPHAIVTVKVETTNGDSINLQPIHTSFLLAGLVGGSERREADGSRVLTATKEKIASATAPVTIKKDVMISLDDNDTDLIDEDGLLADDGGGLLAPPPAVSETKTATDDCGGRKACDDCTCGRAEREAGAAAKEKPKQVPTSSCGNCAKGDAFRCASCPYLGLPAFKPGEEHLVLNLQDDL